MHNVIRLNACRYEDIAKNTKVLNVQELQYYMWVYIDPSDIRNCFLYEIHEIDEAGKHKLMRNSFNQEGVCWVKMQTDLINTEQGLHIYKLSYVDRATDDTFSYYVGYIIQDDNPKKPYVYMDRR